MDYGTRYKLITALRKYEECITALKELEQVKKELKKAKRDIVEVLQGLDVDSFLALEEWKEG